MSRIKNIFSIINQGMSFKDKLGIFLYYFFIYPPKKLKGNLGSLPWNIYLSNSAGKYYINKKMPRHLGSSSEDYELDVQKLMNLRKGVFIDVGAHIGRFSVQIARKLKKGKVICFEPDETNFKTIEKNISLNSLSEKIIPLKMACSDKKGEAKFYILDDGSGGNSLIKMDKHKKGEKIIKTDTLDNIMKKYKLNRLDILKIDVEDAEIKVLNGAKKTLKKFRPKIIFECYGYNKYKKIDDFLTELEYNIERIDFLNYVAIPN